MNASTWQILLIAGFSLLSAVLYALHLWIFNDPRNDAYYTLMDIAFLPVQVVLVGILVNNILSKRDRLMRLEKLNMIIGIFYSELGVALLRHIRMEEALLTKFSKVATVGPGWKKKDFQDAIKMVKTEDIRICRKTLDFVKIKEIIGSKNDFLARLLENQNLLDHERFTDLLWALYHLMEELNYRPDLENLSAPDYEHLVGDTQRAYKLLISEWIAYVMHLKARYPFLFSLSIRTNPFDAKAKVELG